MRAFEIEPLRGVGPIRFGMSRDQVHEQLGSPQRVNDDREWFLSGFAVDFDADGRVEFIEAARSANVRINFHGECLLDMSPDKAVEFVSKFAPYDPSDPELGCSYVFPALQVSLWRPTMPQSDQSADESEGSRFHAVGAATAGYFES